MENNIINNNELDIWVYEFYIWLLVSISMIFFIIYGLIFLVFNYWKQYDWVCNKEVLTKIDFLYTIVTDDWKIVYNKNRIKTAGMDWITCTVVLTDSSIWRVNISDLNLIRNLLEKWLIK